MKNLIMIFIRKFTIKNFYKSWKKSWIDNNV